MDGQVAYKRVGVNNSLRNHSLLLSEGVIGMAPKIAGENGWLYGHSIAVL